MQWFLLVYKQLLISSFDKLSKRSVDKESLIIFSLFLKNIYI